MKWLAKDPRRGGFLDVLDRHIGRVPDEQEIPGFDELGGPIGPDMAMTLRQNADMGSLHKFCFDGVSHCNLDVV